jgi:hypothetical protein
VFERLSQAIVPTPPHLFTPDPKCEDRYDSHQCSDSYFRLDHPKTPFQ